MQDPAVQVLSPSPPLLQTSLITVGCPPGHVMVTVLEVVTAVATCFPLLSRTTYEDVFSELFIIALSEKQTLDPFLKMSVPLNELVPEVRVSCRLMPLL
jgi:hypothetical protein